MSGTSEMVERVAKVLWQSMRAVDIAWEHLFESAKEPYRMKAREAIAAMRESTEDMHNAGIKEASAGGCACEVWGAMIDAALGNPSEIPNSSE